MIETLTKKELFDKICFWKVGGCLQQDKSRGKTPFKSTPFLDGEIDVNQNCPILFFQTGEQRKKWAGNLKFVFDRCSKTIKCNFPFWSKEKKQFVRQTPKTKVLSAPMCIFLKLLWRKTLKVLPKFSLLIFINEELSQKKKNGRERNQGKIKHFNGNHCRRHKN